MAARPSFGTARAVTGFPSSYPDKRGDEVEEGDGDAVLPLWLLHVHQQVPVAARVHPLCAVGETRGGKREGWREREAVPKTRRGAAKGVGLNSTAS